MKDLTAHSILIVDDQPANIKVLFDLLQQTGFRVSVAKSGESALRKAETAQPDLILLDIMMPGMDGYETCERLKSQPATQAIPVIFLSALDLPLNKVKAFTIGGADYITKPFQTEEVLIRVQHQLELSTAKAQILALNSSLEHRIQERTAELVQANQALAKEIAEREQAQKALEYSALHDVLTSLPNRALFTEHLELAQKKAKRQAEHQFAVLFIDLDRFKDINDTMGHQAGDDLLIQVADRLRHLVRETDILARLGGDEFTILLDEVGSLDNAMSLSQRIMETFRRPFLLAQKEVFVTASIGVALNDTHTDGADLLRNADIAMYQAKNGGKARLEVFDQQMYTEVLAKHQLESDLYHALESQEFELHFQPIYNCKTQTIVGFEALIRWCHPQRGWMSPLEFIPLAEEVGLIVPIGRWVLQMACAQLATWRHQFPQIDGLYVSVNLSVQQLREPDFLKQVDQVLQETGLDGQSLHLELTESMLMDDSQTLVNLLKQLVNRGIQLSIDDFGTGYSSLSYLHQFPIHTIKVDQSFIRPMLQQREKRKIVETIVNLAHQLGMMAIAEGIEAKDHLVYLNQLNCEQGQGYFFAKPLPRLAAEQLLSEEVEARLALSSLLL